jgi:hypothetical protein
MDALMPETCGNLPQLSREVLLARQGNWLASGLFPPTVGVMEAVVTKKIVAVVEGKLAEMSKPANAPNNWRQAAGALTDTRLSREADALGREYRKNLTKP